MRLFFYIHLGIFVELVFFILWNFQINFNRIFKNKNLHISKLKAPKKIHIKKNDSK